MRSQLLPAVALQTDIPEEPGKNLGRKGDYLTGVFLRLPHSSQTNIEIVETVAILRNFRLGNFKN
jgi:hypothetical protein